MATTISVEEGSYRFRPLPKRKWIIVFNGIDLFEGQFELKEKSFRFVGKNSLNDIAYQEFNVWVKDCYGRMPTTETHIMVKKLDPIGTVIELWEFVEPFLEELHFGPIHFDWDEEPEVDMKISFTKSIHQF